jgi:hypothetical protein
MFADNMAQYSTLNMAMSAYLVVHQLGLIHKP